MHKLLKTILFSTLVLTAGMNISLAKAPKFNALVVISKAADHIKMMTAAKPFFEKMAAENNFSLEYTDDANKLNDEYLKKVDVFIMLDLAPFDMSYAQQDAVQKFVEEGKGFVAIHAAGLTGQTFGNTTGRYWQWFEDWMGGIDYSPHPKYQEGTLIIEDHKHPATKGLPAKIVMSDEWYEWSASPRGKVHILASADESTYKQNKVMGDHPLVWANEKYPRTIYIGVGHDPSALENKDFARLLLNSVMMTAKKK